MNLRFHYAEGKILVIDAPEKPKDSENPEHPDHPITYSYGGAYHAGVDSYVRRCEEYEKALTQAITNGVLVEDQERAQFEIFDKTALAGPSEIRPNTTYWEVSVPSGVRVRQYMEPADKPGYTERKGVWIDYTNPDFAMNDPDFKKRICFRFTDSVPPPQESDQEERFTRREFEMAYCMGLLGRADVGFWNGELQERLKQWEQVQKTIFEITRK